MYFLTKSFYYYNLIITEETFSKISHIFLTIQDKTKNRKKKNTATGRIGNG